MNMRKLLTTLVAMALVATLFAVPAGAADPPNASGQTNALVRDIAYGGGRIYVGGNFTRARPNNAAPGAGDVVRQHVAAFNSTNGALVPTWAPRVNGEVFAVAVGGGRVYIGGNFTRVRGQPRRNIAALNARTGALLQTWRAGADGTVRALAIGRGGVLYAGGSFTHMNGAVREHLAAIGPGGGLGAWKPRVTQISGVGCPPRCAPVVHTIALSANKARIYVGGHFGRVNAANRNQVAAISRAGKVLAWNPNIFAANQCGTCTPLETHRVYTIIPTPHRIYMCGGFWKAWGTRVTSFNVLATNVTTGKPVPGFGIGTDGDTPGCALKGEILYLGGHFRYTGRACSQRPLPGQPAKACNAATSTRKFHVVAVNIRTNQIRPFNPAPNTPGGVWVVTAAVPGVSFGGYFTRFGGRDQEGIARYAGNPAA
jgi:hypothetical protein